LQSGGNSTWLDNYSKNSIIEQDIKYYIFHSTYPEKIKLLHIDGRYQVEFTCATDGVGKNKPSAYRPSAAGTVPVRNVKKELVTTNKRKPTSTKLSAPTTIVSQNTVGYKVTPRKWKGN
jgi:hypothetical protein